MLPLCFQILHKIRCLKKYNNVFFYSENYLNVLQGVAFSVSLYLRCSRAKIICS